MSKTWDDPALERRAAEAGNAREGVGYHRRAIPRGVYGEASKVVEEALEFADAEEQGVRVMSLVELSDLYGAVQGYLERHHPGMRMDDLAEMAAVTRRAFEAGSRSPR